MGKLVPDTNRQLLGLFGENVFFSLKIIDRTEQVGRILGLAEHIRPVKGGKKTATGRRGILPVESADLGWEPWRLEFRNEDVYLLVNEKIPDLKDRVRFDPQVYSLVYPPVIRQILMRALQVPFEEDESSEHWASLWLKFAQKLHPEHSKPPIDEDEEDQNDWITDVVDSFCKDHALLDKFVRNATASAWEDTV